MHLKSIAINRNTSAGASQNNKLCFQALIFAAFRLWFYQNAHFLNQQALIMKTVMQTVIYHEISAVVYVSLHYPRQRDLL